MVQMVRNDIACNCIPIVRIAFRYAHISFLIAFLRILIAYLRKYSSYLGCCVSQMLAELNLPPLQDRRKANKLTFFFKVVEGLVPAMQSHDYLTPIRGKRHI